MLKNSWIDFNDCSPLFLMGMSEASWDFRNHLWTTWLYHTEVSHFQEIFNPRADTLVVSAFGSRCPCPFSYEKKLQVFRNMCTHPHTLKGYFFDKHCPCVDSVSFLGSFWTWPNWYPRRFWYTSNRGMIVGTWWAHGSASEVYVNGELAWHRG